MRKWKVVEKEEFREGNEIPYTYVIYERKKKKSPGN